MIIAIDGPAGAGKSTTARLVAERLGFAYINTGAMYRAVAVAAREAGLRLPDDVERIVALAESLPIVLRENSSRVLIGERDVTGLLGTAEIAELTSAISAIEGVRSVLVAQQRRLADVAQDECGGAVLEGRDIQTVVCPDAAVKIFLTAEAATRAQRRYAEWQSKGDRATIETARETIETRDRRDSTRETAPLKAAPDAEWLPTDDLTPSQVADRIVSLARQQLDTLTL